MKNFKIDFPEYEGKNLKLTGLDKHPQNNSEVLDRRWQYLREIWDIASESKKDLADCDTPQMRRQIVRSIHSYWDIWMTVFRDNPNMLECFIETFPGAYQSSLDDRLALLYKAVNAEAISKCFLLSSK